MEYIVVGEVYDKFLATLSNKTRLYILNELMGSSKNVSELTSAIGCDQSTISNSLSKLKSCGFVTVEKNGKERVYAINKETIQPLMKLINKHTKKYCTNCIGENK